MTAALVRVPVCDSDFGSLPSLCCGQARNSARVKEERGHTRTAVIVVERIEKQVKTMVERVLIEKLGCKQNC